MKNNASLHSIPALTDNYIWLLIKQQHTVIIDPGYATPVIDFLKQQSIIPLAILLTHYHQDHISGVHALLNTYPSITVYGSMKVIQSLPTIDVQLANGTINLKQFHFDVIKTPGHTLDHLCYYHAPYLFSGDTLFSAGCGRVFEGTMQQMYDSLQRLVRLPDETLICCGHEYTVSNLHFAHSLWPENNLITNALMVAKEQSRTQQTTLPSTLKQEKKINLFLNCHNKQLMELIDNNLNEVQLFAQLRKMKDEFTYT